MLKFSKKIYDPVHGFIRFNELESDLIDSIPFQRLHYIHQLGIAYLVYPGATHTRFEHSLGVMELGTRIFDRIIAKYPIEWRKRDQEYWRQIIRLAALCHDLGHLPFSHAAEKAILGGQGHEQWTLKIIQSDLLQPIWDKVEKLFHKEDVASDVIKISIGEKKLKELDAPAKQSRFTPWERALCQVITGDFFGADRIDYLLRDAQCTGVTYGLFDYHQLIEMLCILPSSTANDETLELGIEENGLESCEALLLARHFMHKRVYQYASVKAYSFHISRFMKSIWNCKNLDDYLFWNDNGVLGEIQRAARDKSHLAHNDALSISQRSHRFRAIEIPAGISDSALGRLKKELDLPDKEIAWEPVSQKKNGTHFNFPVLKSNETVVDGSSCSDLAIPSGPIGWIYVTPTHEKAVYAALQNLESPI